MDLLDRTRVFLMLRERISHSLIDGCILTPTISTGDEGVARVLRDDMIIEEFSCRLSSLFRVGSEVLGLRCPLVFERAQVAIDAEVKGIRRALSTTGPWTGLRQSVKNVRLQLARSASEAVCVSGSVEWSRTAPKEMAASMVHATALISGALARELGADEAGQLAAAYWRQRLTAEERLISLFAESPRAFGALASMEGLLWKMRVFDAVAEAAIRVGVPQADRRRDCTEILGDEVSASLGTLVIELECELVRETEARA